MPTLDESIEDARKLTGFTPGPWNEVTPADNLWPPRVFAAGSKFVCMVDNSDDTQERRINDARLIAAAPDLHRLVLDLAAERERLLAENERLRAHNEELDFLRHEGGPQSVAAMEEALKPFAIAAKIAKGAMQGPADIGHLEAIAQQYVSWEDFKRARAALAQTDPAP